MKYSTVGLHFIGCRVSYVMRDDDCVMLCIADIDVAVSVLTKGYVLCESL